MNGSSWVGDLADIASVAVEVWITRHHPHPAVYVRSGEVWRSHVGASGDVLDVDALASGLVEEERRAPVGCTWQQFVAVGAGLMEGYALTEGLLALTRMGRLVDDPTDRTWHVVAAMVVDADRHGVCLFVPFNRSPNGPELEYDRAHLIPDLSRVFVGNAPGATEMFAWLDEINDCGNRP